ncbi:HEPN domain-containing protein [Candidatus Poribacteria bacterium]|nr:HEPN domain-containing protein [Candidatus Poribacteria bacterium]
MLGHGHYPVKYRVPTKLSKPTNQQWSLAWLTGARRDLSSAEKLIEAELFENAVYHCQQS